jgi:hypothetical protein
MALKIRLVIPLYGYLGGWTVDDLAPLEWMGGETGSGLIRARAAGTTPVPFRTLIAFRDDDKKPRGLLG